MGRSEVVIRTGGVEDQEAVLALWERARSVHARTADTRDTVSRLLAHTPDALLVATKGEDVIGALIAAWDGWRGNLYRLAVDPGHRREGIARLLVEAGEARVRAQGARRITALVARGDEVAGALWRAAGYAADPEIGRWVRNV